MRHLLKSVFIFIILAMCLNIFAASSTKDFSAACTAYEGGNFEAAKQLFERKTKASPSGGAFLNLGNTEWRLGNTAAAIVAWERALLLNPFDGNAENNLRFARENAQLESPELTWCEIAAGWLPANLWAWLACGSLWFAVGAMIVPGVLRWRRSATQQAVVALSLGILLLTLPANYGVVTRSQTGFVLERETPLRLTPTAEAEAVTKLAAGEPGRVVRERGNYLLIRTRRTTGWVERDGFALIAPR